MTVVGERENAGRVLAADTDEIGDAMDQNARLARAGTGEHEHVRPHAIIGSQFTSVDFTTVLKNAGIAISMDGKGAWRDNVFVERLWRTVKYEEVYLRAYASVSEARASIGRYLTSTIGRGPIRRLAGGRPIRHISAGCSQSRRQHNQGGNPLNHRPDAVRRIRATSLRLQSLNLTPRRGRSVP